VRELILPALIVKSQHAAALVQGAPLPGGSLVYKTAECRGLRCDTEYRGAVAIFCSGSYDSSIDEHYIWWIAHCDKRKLVTPGEDRRVRDWCRESAKWRYTLMGFVRLTNSVRTVDVHSERELKRLALAATDYRIEWDPAVYLEVEPLYACETPTKRPDLPRFDAACTGCHADPPHNATACHVNWQTVSLAPEVVPIQVRKEVGAWPTQRGKKVATAA